MQHTCVHQHSQLRPDQFSRCPRARGWGGGPGAQKLNNCYLHKPVQRLALPTRCQHTPGSNPLRWIYIMPNPGELVPWPRGELRGIGGIGGNWSQEAPTAPPASASQTPTNPWRIHDTDAQPATGQVPVSGESGRDQQTLYNTRGDRAWAPRRYMWDLRSLGDEASRILQARSLQVQSVRFP